MAGVNDSDYFGTVFLIEEIVCHSHLGITTPFKGIVDRKVRCPIVNGHSRVAAVASDIWILALCRRRGLVADVVHIIGSWRASKGPSWVARGVIKRLAKEPHRCIAVCKFRASLTNITRHLLISNLRDSSCPAGGTDDSKNIRLLESHYGI